MKRLKNLIIPILCVLALLIFAGEPLREANAKSLSQTVETVSTNNSLNGRLNQQESNILNTLTENIRFVGMPGMENLSEGKSEYESFLVQYLGRKQVNLSANTLEQVDSRMKEVNYLLQMENKTKVSELSTDSKEIAVGLTKDIFSVCGLAAGFNPSGELISLSDKSGNLTLTDESSYKKNINSGILLLVISIVGILQVVCYILSRKSRIMIKDVKYNGFHKEEYAR